MKYTNFKYTLKRIKNKYYYTAIKKANNRCKDCNKLLSIGKPERCSSCNRFFHIKNSYNKTKKTLLKNFKFLIWFVGFWEGEGNIKIYKRKYKTGHVINRIYEGYKLSVAQKETSCLLLIKNKFKCGGVYGLGKKNVCSNWATDNLGEIIALIEFMLPLIKSPRRRKQIKALFKETRFKFYRNRL
jgi:hypothetical protein